MWCFISIVLSYYSATRCCISKAASRLEYLVGGALTVILILCFVPTPLNAVVAIFMLLLFYSYISCICGRDEVIYTWNSAEV